MQTARAMVLVAVSAFSAWAQSATPELTIVAPAAPGGGWDQTARAMQASLRATGLAPNVQVVNTAGAAGTIGLARFVNSEAGNPNSLLVTGLVMVSGIAANHSPVSLADVTPIARLSGEYEVIVVPASSPFKSFGDLLAAFKADPRSISWGGGSAGGTDEILVRLIAGKTGVSADGVNYIAYSGGGQALASVLGAHVSAAVSGLGEFGAQIESGDLRALAISSESRLPASSIPTLRELGVDVTLLNWRGIVAPPGISRAERAAITDLVRRMASSADWKNVMDRSGWADIYMEGDAFARFITDETRRVAPIVASTNRSGGTDWFEVFVFAGLVAATVAAVVEWRRAAATVPSDGKSNLIAFVTLAAALVVDAAIIDWVGFAIASGLLFGLTARAFGSRRPVRDIAIGLALSTAIQFGFARGLGVHLPLARFM